METSACSRHGGDHAHIHVEETCRHELFRHGDHIDFEHDGHWHAKHGDHWDEHAGPEG
ncbi:MAG: zinc transporter permease [Candidatus Limnocylindria bacterium]